MVISGFFFQFPLFHVGKPAFPVVQGFLPVFTELLHAERWRDGNTIMTVENVDHLSHLADVYFPHVEGVCFDPVKNGTWTAKVFVKWDVLRQTILQERNNSLT